MYIRIHPSWQRALQSEWSSPYFTKLAEFVRQAYSEGEVYPPAGRIFAALDACPFDKVKVVIVGQDPYHEPGQANGLAFSVKPGVKLPPSLRNILTELQADCGVTPTESGDLTAWARQGVFLLNSSLSVEAGKAASHQAFGWQTFTDAAVRAVAALPQPVAFVLWGGHAQKKAALAADSPYPRLVLQAPHPSPLSAYRGFFGSRPFSKINAFLEASGSRAIDWRL